VPSIINALGAGLEGASRGWTTAVAQEEREKAAASLMNRAPDAPVEETPPAQAAPKPPEAPLDPKLQHIVAAIYGQESGSGANPATSTAGARGGMQIIPSTFNAYAKPGERIDDPADNKAVGERIIADLYRRANGDPGRVAVGYFSGPGNMTPLAFGTPWREDKVDTNGKSTSGYVADVLRRINTLMSASARN
jgi:soluble lytic murein transglycosylase-like protein